MKKLFPFPTLNTSQECADHLSQMMPFTTEYIGGFSQSALSSILQRLSTPSHRRFLGACSWMFFVGCLLFGANAFEYGSLVRPWLALVSVIMLAFSSTICLRLFDDFVAPRWYQKLYASFTKLPFEPAHNAVINHRWDDPSLHVFFDNPQRFRVLSKDEVECHHRTYTSLPPNNPCRLAWEDRMKVTNPLRQQDVMIMQQMVELYNQEQQALLSETVTQSQSSEVYRSVEQEQLEWRQSLMQNDDVVDVEQESLEIVMSSSANQPKHEVSQYIEKL